MSEIDEIKQKMDIVQLVSEYVTDLKQAGANWKARCPFHEEKTPSFMVSQEKQIFHCFGCGKGGDIFTFVQEMEGMEFPEALRLLAKKAGVKLKQQDPKIHSKKTRLLDIQKWAAAYWCKVLQETDLAKKARAYLKDRGVSKETIMDFKIGFAPDFWDKIFNFLKSKGFNESEISLAGLIKQKDRGSGYYDRFRNRIIFPICDLHGTIIAFGGRAMDEELGAKYLNSPQTMIYDKSFVIYGLDKAKKSIKENDLAIFVEGYMDVISSHQAGVKNVVATSGTALTSGHIKLIKRYTNNVAFCFDQDAAGQMAAQRSIDIALKEDVNIKMIQLEFGKDPDECIKKDVELWKKSIENSIPYMKFCLDSVKNKYDLKDINQKKSAAKEILIQLAKIESKIEQDFWMKQIAEVFQINERFLWEAMPRSPIKKQEIKIDSNGQKQSQNIDVYKRLFGLLIVYPENISYIADSLEMEMIKDEKWRGFYNDLILLYNKENRLSKNQLEKFIKQKENDRFDQGFFDSLGLITQQQFQDFSEQDIQNELIFLAKRIKKNYLREKIDHITEKIKQLESRSESDNEVKKLFEEFQKLTWQISRLD